jgi:hypothetical protein
MPDIYVNAVSQLDKAVEADVGVATKTFTVVFCMYHI